MKKSWLLVVFIVGYSCVLAQKPELPSTALRMEQIKQGIIQTKLKRDSIVLERRSLVLPYHTEEEKQQYNAISLEYKKRLKENRLQYVQLLREREDLRKEEIQYKIDLMEYHKSQDYYKYRRRAKWNKTIGITFLAGGTAFSFANLVGLASEPRQILTLEESIRYENQKRFHKIGLASGLVILNSSIYFLVKAKINNKKYLENIAFDVDVRNTPNYYSQQPSYYFNLRLAIK